MMLDSCALCTSPLRTLFSLKPFVIAFQNSQRVGVTLIVTKLHINSNLTNCETGDRIYFVKPNTLKSPLPDFMYFGKFKGKVVHFRQETTYVARTPKCNNCLENGPRTDQCESDRICKLCKKDRT